MPGAFGPCGPDVEGPPTTRFLDEGTTPTTTSTKFRATRCYRSWAMRRRRDAWQMPKQWNYWYGMYTWYIHITAWHMIYHIIFLSIYLSIHLSTYLHTVNIIAGMFFVWWFALFLHTVVSIWRYLWSFLLWGVFNYWHIIVYYSVIWDHEVDKNPSQSLINN